VNLLEFNFSSGGRAGEPIRWSTLKRRLVPYAETAGGAAMDRPVRREALEFTGALRPPGAASKRAFELGRIVNGPATIFRGDAIRFADRDDIGLDRAKLAEGAKNALEKAKALAEKGDHLAAREMYSRAYLLAIATGDGAGESAALKGLADSSDKLLETWTKAIPALDRKLDLVIRDKSLAEALAEVSKAAGLKIALVPGSVADACSVTNRKRIRVIYLDCRRATVAQALDWILHPVRMTWRVDGGVVTAATCRRLTGESPWVYDVAVLAVPEKKELADVKDYPAQVAAVRNALDDFLAAARKRVGAGDEAVVWYAPGELLVFGDAKTHALAAQFLAELADPNAKPAADSAELHKLASARAESRKEAEAKRLAAIEKMRVLGALRTGSWRILAGAACGEVDREALTVLQAAWRRPETAEFLAADASAPLALRSLWAITEASKAMPDEAELAALAAKARAESAEAARAALATLKKKPDDQAAFLGTLYAVLAMPDDKAFAAEARPLLTSGDEKSPLAPVRKVVDTLMSEPADADREALADIIREGLAGEDMVTLTALAARRAGGDAWTAFRAESTEILGRQPLPGSVVVLVNSLARPTLPIVAKR
jgi:hypothetical protein